MALAGIIETAALCGAVVGIAYFASRKLAWSDARPVLPPLSIYGEWIALPAEAKIGGASNLRAGSGKADATDIGSEIAPHREVR